MCLVKFVMKAAYFDEPNMEKERTYKEKEITIDRNMWDTLTKQSLSSRRFLEWVYFMHYYIS